MQGEPQAQGHLFSLLCGSGPATWQVCRKLLFSSELRNWAVQLCGEDGHLGDTQGLLSGEGCSVRAVLVAKSCPTLRPHGP